MALNRRCTVCGDQIADDGACPSDKSPFDVRPGSPEFFRASLHADIYLGAGDLYTRLVQVQAIKTDSSLLRRAAWRVCRALGYQGWFLDRVYPPRPAPPRPPEPSIAELLESADDSDLCDGVFKRIDDRLGRIVFDGDLTRAGRIVRLVWHANGIIGNGGFEYLFSDDFESDPGYRLTAEAFAEIGCDEAAGAFREAFGLFPGGEFPDDPEERMTTYKATDEAVRQAINERFFREMWSDNIEKRLAEFIRSNADEFRRLDDGG